MKRARRITSLLVVTLLVGGMFVTISGLVYFAFMAAWLIAVLTQWYLPGQRDHQWAQRWCSGRRDARSAFRCLQRFLLLT
jgi:fatty acid desaturase